MSHSGEKLLKASPTTRIPKKIRDLKTRLFAPGDAGNFEDLHCERMYLAVSVFKLCPSEGPCYETHVHLKVNPGKKNVCRSPRAGVVCEENQTAITIGSRGR